MNNKLILRALTSPFPTPYTDTTKGSVLSHADVDNNFIYLKGQTIYSAETVSQTAILYKLNGDILSFPVGSGSGGGIQNYIRPSDTINIAQDFQYFVYGDLTLDGGIINNSGEIVIMNGAFINSGGTYNQIGSGTMLLVDSETIGKFTIITGFTANTPLIIHHNLGTQDIIVSIKDLNTGQKIVLGENNYNFNDVTITSTNTLTNIKITIIG